MDGYVGISDDHDQQEGTEAGVGSEPLFTVNHPFIAIPGSTVLVDDDLAERFLNAARSWIAERDLKIVLSDRQCQTWRVSRHCQSLVPGNQTH